MLKELMFFLSSMIEGVAVFWITLSLFRFRVTEYLWGILFIVMMHTLSSHTLRFETDLSFTVPLISIVFLALFLQVVVEIPLFWACVMAFTGSFAYAFIQTLLLSVLQWVDIVTVESVQSNTPDTYLIMLSSAVTAILLGTLAYKKGIGFTFSFSQFNFAGINLALFILIIIALVVLIVTFIFKNLVFASVFLALTSGALIYSQIRKERKDG